MKDKNYIIKKNKGVGAGGSKTNVFDGTNVNYYDNLIEWINMI